ncbi:hypothetical protein HAX54_038356 [Datura stramonium]|uniref:Uncharacterized protein n=1 Tax=Datura stramonium TaxID=4076 RepID=A0ABS8SI13_DATST|nr:hypothetical protein [Datura stramonium]
MALVWGFNGGAAKGETEGKKNGEDQFDTVDLSDNEIVKLENFPYLNRLGTLLMNNNRITRINPNIGEFLPKLHTLILTSNRLTNLVEIDPLASLPKLKVLSLLDNNITKRPNYRLYVIHKLKSLRLLDFRKVKQKERLEAIYLHHKKLKSRSKRNPVKSSVPVEAAIRIPKLSRRWLDLNSMFYETYDDVCKIVQAQSGQLPADLNTDYDVAAKKKTPEEDKMVTDGDDKANKAEENKHLNRKMMVLQIWSRCKLF